MPPRATPIPVPARVSHTTHTAPAHVSHTTHNSTQQARSHGLAIMSRATSGGYRFTNFNGPTPGPVAVAGTGANMNGITNSGTAVGFTIGDGGTYVNFTAQPLRSKATRILNFKGSTAAMAFGINSAGTVEGSDGHGSAFALSRGGALKTFTPTGGKSATAFGINDQGTIVGQYVTAAASPGFIRVGGKSYVTIDAPSGTNIVSAQGINNNSRVVGFYVGTNGQDQIEETGLGSEPFPLHAPELNPVDRVWGYVKYNRIPNFAPPDLGVLRSTLTLEFDRVGSMPDLLKSLIGSTGLPLAFCNPD
jgi:hypothetical protein